jgi:hypothetical protein
MVEFDPLFPVMPGTQRRAAAPDLDAADAFKAQIGLISAESAGAIRRAQGSPMANQCHTASSLVGDDRQLRASPTELL